MTSSADLTKQLNTYDLHAHIIISFVWPFKTGSLECYQQYNTPRGASLIPDWAKGMFTAEELNPPRTVERFSEEEEGDGTDGAK